MNHLPASFDTWLSTPPELESACDHCGVDGVVLYELAGDVMCDTCTAREAVEKLYYFKLPVRERAIALLKELIFEAEQDLKAARRYSPTSG